MANHVHVTLMGSDNTYLNYPCTGLLELFEIGTTGGITTGVFRREGGGAPVVVKNPHFVYPALTEQPSPLVSAPADESATDLTDLIARADVFGFDWDDYKGAVRLLVELREKLRKEVAAIDNTEDTFDLTDLIARAKQLDDLVEVVAGADEDLSRSIYALQVLALEVQGVLEAPYRPGLLVAAAWHRREQEQSTRWMDIAESNYKEAQAKCKDDPILTEFLQSWAICSRDANDHRRCADEMQRLAAIIAEPSPMEGEGSAQNPDKPESSQSRTSSPMQCAIAPTRSGKSVAGLQYSKFVDQYWKAVENPDLLK
ncbi:hypothetical protein [Rhizobium sp. LCM 4573]|uniref:hypothetical protein n=1 Tax=Rhizobium sp. LCM 4573 TaxID=1848291 RepID=UPI0008DAD468|nr:hypothetical protein [Rhizobium sp. LCM 4573]OHV78260.1 hypothetical protein LCM4573_26895 [Rhizobium sp. LCM 4573]